jgi:hypothetical protein
MKKIFVIIFLVLSSCSPIATEMPSDASILTDSGCNLPCWYGINIGSTTKDELLKILANTSFVNRDSITITKSINKLFDERVHFTMGRGPKSLKVDSRDTVIQNYLYSGDIAIRNNKVVQIILAGELGITFQRLVDIFGEPSYLIPFPTTGGHIWVESINPSQGLDFGFRAEDHNSELTPDTPISQIMLFDTKLYDEMKQHKLFFYSLYTTSIEKYGWKGFGRLDLYLRNE